MRFICLTLLAFLCGALLASVLDAQEPQRGCLSTRRAIEPTSNSILDRQVPFSDVESDCQINQWQPGNPTEIVRVAQNYWTPQVNANVSRQVLQNSNTIVFQSPAANYEEQSFIQDLSTPFNPPVPSSQLEGPAFGDTYFSAKPVDEWSGFCNMKNVQTDFCGWFNANSGCCDRCGAKRHQPCGKNGCHSSGCKRDNGCNDGCSDCECSHGQGSSLHRDRKCGRARF